ncbi:MAG: hypothetical protein AABX70_08985 [Nanoarchaeota archaeon]
MRFTGVLILVLCISLFSVWADTQEFEGSKSKFIEQGSIGQRDDLKEVLGPFFAAHPDAFTDKDKNEMMQFCDQPEALANKMLEKLKAIANGDLKNMCETSEQDCYEQAVLRECDQKQVGGEKKQMGLSFVECPPNQEHLFQRCLESESSNHCEEEWQRQCGGYGSSANTEDTHPMETQVMEVRSARLMEARPLECPDYASLKRKALAVCGDQVQLIYKDSCAVDFQCRTATANSVTGSVIYNSPSNRVLDKYRKGWITGRVVEGSVGATSTAEATQASWVETPNAGICPQDTIQCPDGSWISRGGPNCKFTPCSVQPAVPVFSNPIPVCGNDVCESGEAEFCPPCHPENDPCVMACSRGSCPEDCSRTQSSCGNGVCEEGEASDCPLCTKSNPPCMVPCRVGSCQQDCQARTCPVDTPLPYCKGNIAKKIDDKGCPHYYCEGMACPLYEMQRCGPNERLMPNGLDAQGCQLPGKCVFQENCPLVPVGICKPGEQEVPNGLDEKGCQLPPVCKSINTACQMVKVPVCPQGALNKQLDERGCPVYSCKVGGEMCDKELFFKKCQGRQEEYKKKCYEYVEQEYERLKKQCESPEDWKEKCYEHIRERCSHPISKDHCLELISEERLYQMLLRKTADFCRFKKDGLQSGLNHFAKQSEEHREELQQKSEEVVQVQADVKQMEQVEEEKGLRYKFKSLFGLMKEQELSEAKRIRENIQKLDETIQVLKQVSEGLSDPLVQAALADQMTSLRMQQAQLEKLASEKEKRAKGLFGLFG